VLTNTGEQHATLEVTMSAVLKLCQERYDAQLPPEVSESDELNDWLEHSAEQLVCGVDIIWKRRHGQPRVVTFDQYGTYLQGILNQRQITDSNPAAGVRKNKEVPRDFYATEEIWSAVYAVATSELRDAMDLAYLTGQRPADALSMREADAVNEFLQVAQGKTSKKLRIRLTAAGVLNDLGALVERLMEQRRSRGVRSTYLIVTEDGRQVTKPMLRLRFDDARDRAIATARETETGFLRRAFASSNSAISDRKPPARS
jgi:integrase